MTIRAQTGPGAELPIEGAGAGGVGQGAGFSMGSGSLSALSPTWTREQDDRAAFDEAMAVADVSLRRLSAQHHKLRRVIDTMHRANHPRTRDGQYGKALALLDHIQSLCETPPISRWRQEHNEGRGRKHSQQHVLERKLARARDLLAERGIDLDAEHIEERPR